MPRNIEDVLRDLDAVDLESEGYLETLRELCKEARELPDRELAIGPVLRLMERNPGRDWGSPGPLVHFLEKLPGYVPELLRSIERAPVEHTLWMLNRVINALHGKQRDEHIAILRRVADDARLTPSVRDEARFFIEHQEGEGA